MASIVMLFLICYMYISIYGVLNIRAELRPEQLFLQNSDVIKVIFLKIHYTILLRVYYSANCKTYI